MDGHLAFVPPPLPPRIGLGPGLVAALDEASAAVGELAGVTRRMANPGLLIAPYLRREAVLSSRIEGTQSTLTDVYEKDPAWNKPRDAQLFSVISALIQTLPVATSVKTGAPA